QLEPRRHRPVEAVAIAEIVAPFLVAHKVGPGDLDLDDGDEALAVDRHHVRPPAVGQRHLAQGERILVEEQPGYAARDVLRRGRCVGEAELRLKTRDGGHGPGLEYKGNAWKPSPYIISGRRRGCRTWRPGCGRAIWAKRR